MQPDVPPTPRELRDPTASYQAGRLFLAAIVLALLAALIAAAVYAARDMSRRGQPGWLYGALCLFVPLIGHLVYASARQKHPLLRP